MPDPTELTGEPAEVTLNRIIELGFGGDEERFNEFVRVLQESVPADSCVLLRGSAVSGSRWADGAPFDSEGPGSSDLDLTFIGGEMLKLWEHFYIPGLHTVPLCDERPEAAPALLPLRQRLSAIAGRPVNIQATSDLVQYIRDVIMRQPYYVLIDRKKEDEEQSSSMSMIATDEAAQVVEQQG